MSWLSQALNRGFGRPQQATQTQQPIDVRRQELARGQAPASAMTRRTITPDERLGYERSFTRQPGTRSTSFGTPSSSQGQYGQSQDAFNAIESGQALAPPNQPNWGQPYVINEQGLVTNLRPGHGPYMEGDWGGTQFESYVEPPPEVTPMPTVEVNQGPSPEQVVQAIVEETTRPLMEQIYGLTEQIMAMQAPQMQGPAQGPAGYTGPPLENLPWWLQDQAGAVGAMSGNPFASGEFGDWYRGQQQGVQAALDMYNTPSYLGGPW